MRLFMTVMPLAYLCGNIYILIKLWHCLGKSCNAFGLLNFGPVNLWIRIAIMVLMVLISSSLFISIGIRNSEVPFWLMKLLHTIGSVWMVYMFYLIMILLPTDIARMAIPALKSAAWFTSSKLFCGGSLVVTAVLIAGYINYINPKVLHLSISHSTTPDSEIPHSAKSTTDTEIPHSAKSTTDAEISHSAKSATERLEQIQYNGMKPLRIVAISDVHLGYGTGKWLTRRYIDLINRQNPDIVLIAGDLIDNSTTPVSKQQLHLELNKLQAPLGIYLAPGNHEYISGIEACKRLLAETHVKILQDSVVSIHYPANCQQQPGYTAFHIHNSMPTNKTSSITANSMPTDKTSSISTNSISTDTTSSTSTIGKLLPAIQIIGRDDRYNRNRKSLEELLAETDRECPTIVIDHQPYNLAQTDSLGVFLQISGHTHRGQIWPLNLLTDNIYEQSHGYRKWSNSHIFVSCGLSLWGPPFRIGTRSDLAVIEIQL